MKKIIFFCATVLIFSSCSSTPKQEEKKTEAVKTETAAPVKDDVKAADQQKQADNKKAKPVADIGTGAEAESMAATDAEIVGDDSAAYSETTTTTTTSMNEAARPTATVEEVESSILDSEYGRFDDYDYAEYEDSHGVQTFYEPSYEPTNEEYVTTNELQSFKVDNGVSTYVSAASNRRFVTEETTGSFENGLYETSKRCHLRAGPSKQSEILGVVPVGKVIWADDTSARWAKVYRQEGAAYIHKGCL